MNARWSLVSYVCFLTLVLKDESSEMTQTLFDKALIKVRRSFRHVTTNEYRMYLNVYINVYISQFYGLYCDTVTFCTVDKRRYYTMR